MTETGGSFSGRSKFEGPGGTPGELGEVVVGLLMMAIGVYIVFDHVTVHTSFWRFFGSPGTSFGLTLIPLLGGIGVLFFNGRSVLGWILLIAGAFLFAGAFSAHSVGTLLLRIVWALLTLVVGFWLIVEPHNGTLTLTLVLGLYFVFVGVTRLVVAFLARGQQNAGLVGLSGFLGLLVGILVLAKLPSSADWAIGLLVGIDLIFAGWMLTSVALVGKELSRA